jgi:hypothetical protein
MVVVDQGPVENFPSSALIDLTIPALAIIVDYGCYRPSVDLRTINVKRDRALCFAPSTCAAWLAVTNWSFICIMTTYFYTGISMYTKQPVAFALSLP